MRKLKGMVISTLGLATSTMASRVLGLLRDMLIAAALGASAANAAWVVGLIAPNLFRRIFGEGAVGTALVPIMAESLEQNQGRQEAGRRLWAILWTVGGILTAITILGILGIVLYQWYWLPADCAERYRLTVEAIPVALPYAAFICMAGVATSALNVVKEFFWPSVASLLFNICTIAVVGWQLLAGRPWDDRNLLMLMCLSVVVSGALQFLWMVALLRRQGLAGVWALHFSKLPWRETLSELWRLSLPGLVGASALQISLVVDWALAMWLGAEAVAGISYSERIIYLPISVVALSLGVVGMSHMTTAAARGELSEVKNVLNFAMRMTLFLSVPIAVFTMFFGEGVIRVLFERGRFDDLAVESVRQALVVFAVGIPAFCLSKITVAGFQSRKQMKTPVKAAIWGNVANLIVGLSTMWWWGQAGLALAMVLSSVVNNGLLLYWLKRDLGDLGLRKVMFSSIKDASCAVVAALPWWWAWDLWPRVELFRGLSVEFTPLLISGIGFLLLCGLLLLLCGGEEAETLKTKLRAKLRRRI